MDDAKTAHRNPAVSAIDKRSRVAGRGVCGEALRRLSVEHSLVQILVLVANTRMRNPRAEVEKGSMRTVVDHGLVGPKANVRS